LGVYLFPFTSATKLHFFLGGFLHFITGDDIQGIGDCVLYTGPIDQFFEYSLGWLEYHGLRFEEEVRNEPDYQGQAIKNCPDEEPPCRIIEHRHFTGAVGKKTVITREYGEEWIPGRGRYHPVEDERNRALHKQYLELAKAQHPNFVFGGRMGEHRDYTMAETIAAALKKVKELTDHS